MASGIKQRVNRWAMLGLLTLAFLLVDTSIVMFTAEAQTNADQPDVLLIILDDASYDIDLYGGRAYMPNLQRIADIGVTFDNATVDSVGCNPSRFSFFSGIMPENSGITSMSDLNEFGTSMKYPRDYIAENPNSTIGRDFKSLPRLLRDSGYYTFGSGKIFHNKHQQVGSQQDQDANGQINSGWSTVMWNHDAGDLHGRAINEPLGLPPELIGMFTEGKSWGALEDLEGDDFSDADQRDAIIAESLVDFLEGAEAPAVGNQPLFAAVGLLDTHTPRYPPQELIDLYEGVPLPQRIENDWDDMGPFGRLDSNSPRDKIIERYLFDDEAYYREFYTTLLAAHTYTDRKIGEVIDAWEASGRSLEDSIVVVWSDHGQHAGQKQKLEKGTLWRESVRVPLLIAAPGLASGEHTDEYVNGVDVFQTILDLTHTPVNDYEREGVSLKYLLEDPSASTGKHAEVHWQDKYAIIDENYWLISYNNKNPGSEEYELYDNQSDPYQWNNLYYQPSTKTKFIVNTYASYWNTGGSDDVIHLNTDDTDGPELTDIQPGYGSVVLSGTTNISGMVTDQTAVGSVRVRIQDLTSRPRQYWDGSGWVDEVTIIDAELAQDRWVARDVDLQAGRRYQIVLWAWDTLGNRSDWKVNPKPIFSVVAGDGVGPMITDVFPADGSTVGAGAIDATGIVSDETGVASIKVRVKDVTNSTYWDGESWIDSFVLVEAEITEDTWRLPGVEFTSGHRYILALWAWDVEGNVSNWRDNPRPNFFSA